MSEMNSNVLSLKGVRITKLPNGFKITGDLDLRGSFIIKLPKNLRVLGNLILNEHIEEIPEDIMISGNLDMSESNISKLPSYFAICGNIIGSKYNLSKPSFTPNTVYKNIVCCDDGTLVLYQKFIFHKRQVEPEQKEKEPLIFYYGLNGTHAVSMFKQKKIFPCETFSLGERIADIYILNQRDLSVYKNLNVTKKIYTIEELKNMFIDICGPCEEGVENFIKDINLDNTKKYSIKDLLLLLPKFAKYDDYFLFENVFEKQLEKSKRDKYLIIN